MSDAHRAYTPVWCGVRASFRAVASGSPAATASLKSTSGVRRSALAMSPNWRSVSKSTTLARRDALPMPTARLVATVVLPAPPFGDSTTMTRPAGSSACVADEVGPPALRPSTAPARGGSRTSSSASSGAMMSRIPPRSARSHMRGVGRGEQEHLDLGVLLVERRRPGPSARARLEVGAEHAPRRVRRRSPASRTWSRPRPRPATSTPRRHVGAEHGLEARLAALVLGDEDDRAHPKIVSMSSGVSCAGGRIGGLAGQVDRAELGRERDPLRRPRRRRPG